MRGGEEHPRERNYLNTEHEISTHIVFRGGSMLSQIKSFLTPPQLTDEDKTAGARLLYMVSEIGLVGAVILVFIFTFVSKDFGTRLYVTSIAIPLLLLEMVLIKKGCVNFAAYFVVVMTWIGGNYSNLVTGGMQSVGFGINLVIVLEAGMLISLRAGLVVAAISSLAGLGMAIVQTHRITASPYEINVFAAWGTQSLFLGLMAGILYISVDQIQKSLARTKRTEARMRGIIDNAPDVIMEVDSSGIITLINRNQDLYLGRPVGELIHTADMPKINSLFERAFATGISGSLEVQLLSPYGSNIWASLRAGPIAEDGKVTSLAVIVNDITERKRTETEIIELNLELEERVKTRTAQLEATNKELEAFSFSVSHDLRAPLRSIIGFSNILKEKYASVLDEDGQDYLQKVVAYGKRMDQLIVDLLNFSQVGHKPLALQNIDLDSLIRTVIDSLALDTAGHQVEWIFSNSGSVTADPALIRQIYANLIGNAVKYTSKTPSARIEIGSIKQNGEKIYFVRDNGAGFDMKYADNLFGVFRRLHSESEFEGTGVGLAIVQRIIHRHGGRIWAEAEVSKGAAFYFTLAEKIG
jgi:PAS domain S-box-containing protein